MGWGKGVLELFVWRRHAGYDYCSRFINSVFRMLTTVNLLWATSVVCKVSLNRNTHGSVNGNFVTTEVHRDLTLYLP